MRLGRILVVDDQPANVRVVSALLERNGYTVGHANGGDAAFAALRQQLPDLILLDLLMPGMDGFEVLRAMKQDSALMRIPAICLTSMQDRELLVQAFENGAVDYVTKPFIAEELLARVGAQIALKLARDRLERIAQERQELVNLVAHDLKNPLTSIRFACEILESGVIAAERVPRYFEMIQSSTEDALDYIRRYLETQDRGAQRVDDDATAAIGAVIAALAQRYELQCEGRGIALRTTPPQPDILVRADAVMLRQVCENLITNAIKYAAEGGEIHVAGAASSPGFARLVVEDRGPGIAAPLQRKLFKPFVRLSEHDPLGGLSSGLGLSLARRNIAQAGGQLFYEDRDGGGARFVIELPRG